MLRKCYLILCDFSEQIKKQNINAFAASMAFFIFLSLVPMLVVICAIIPYTPLTEENLMTAVTEITPEMMDPLVHMMISEVYDKSAGILSIAVITTLWTAGKGVMALIQGLNAINGVEEKRNYFVVRMSSSIYTFLMLVVVLISLLVMVFGNQLVDVALHRFPTLQLIALVIMQFRFLLVWILLALIFTAIYAFVPSTKMRFREQFPGALFASVGWIVFSWGFSMYVEHSGSYSMYGSLSLIVIIMLWMYFCMYIMLVGAYMNRYFRPVNKVLVRSNR
ncbi:MAG: YihY/virulence factor BrkB family protein [Acetatifactor sp.]|nr:YihY/virulence factor BrkB family protein [Acetatifactor sp.]